MHVAKDLLNQEVSSLGLHGPISSDASVEVTTLALRCLAHLFTWVPLTTVISPRLLASVFHFAGLAIPEVMWLYCTKLLKSKNKIPLSFLNIANDVLSILFLNRMEVH